LSKCKEIEPENMSSQNNTELLGKYKNIFLFSTSMATRCLEKDLNRN